VEARFANLPPCLIGMEACVGAHHLSRKLKALGHDARLMPAKYVRPSAFAAAPRSNSSLWLFNINWPFCTDNALVDTGFHSWIGFYGCCSTGSGPRSLTRWYWLSPQP
jgi:hypothetical protein